MQLSASVPSSATHLAALAVSGEASSAVPATGAPRAAGVFAQLFASFGSATAAPTVSTLGARAGVVSQAPAEAFGIFSNWPALASSDATGSEPTGVPALVSCATGLAPIPPNTLELSGENLFAGSSRVASGGRPTHALQSAARRGEAVSSCPGPITGFAVGSPDVLPVVTEPPAVVVLSDRPVETAQVATHGLTSELAAENAPDVAPGVMSLALDDTGASVHAPQPAWTARAPGKPVASAVQSSAHRGGFVALHPESTAGSSVISAALPHPSSERHPEFTAGSSVVATNVTQPPVAVAAPDCSGEPVQGSVRGPMSEKDPGEAPTVAALRLGENRPALSAQQSSFALRTGQASASLAASVPVRASAAEPIVVGANCSAAEAEAAQPSAAALAEVAANLPAIPIANNLSALATTAQPASSSTVTGQVLPITLLPLVPASSSSRSVSELSEPAAKLAPISSMSAPATAANPAEIGASAQLVPSATDAEAAEQTLAAAGDEILGVRTPERRAVEVPEGRQENFAASSREIFGVQELPDPAPEKTFLNALEKRLTSHDPDIGTDVAKTLPTMPAATPVSHPATAAVPTPALAVVPTDFVPRADALLGSNPDTGLAAHRAVDAVLTAAERFSAGDQHAVNLQFSVGGADLSVHVELRANEVRATFHTDSVELRAALAHEWQSVGPDTAGRTLRLGAPVFAANDSSGSAAFSGDSAPRQRDAGAHHSAGENFATVAPRVRATSTVQTTGGAGASAPRIVQPGTSLHLHTLA